MRVVNASVYHQRMTTAHAFFAVILCIPSIAGSQVFRCTDTAGKVHFSDQVCDAGHKSREVKIDKFPAQAKPPTPATSAEDRASEVARRQKSDALQKDIRDSARKVRDMKIANFNPGKCDAAHRSMAQMERSDPLLYKLDIDYIQASQAANLYCGN